MPTEITFKSGITLVEPSSGLPGVSYLSLDDALAEPFWHDIDSDYVYVDTSDTAKIGVITNAGIHCADAEAYGTHPTYTTHGFTINYQMIDRYYSGGSTYATLFAMPIRYYNDASHPYNFLNMYFIVGLSNIHEITNGYEFSVSYGYAEDVPTLDPLWHQSTILNTVSLFNASLRSNYAEPLTFDFRLGYSLGFDADNLDQTAPGDTGPLVTEKEQELYNYILTLCVGVGNPWNNPTGNPEYPVAYTINNSGNYTWNMVTTINATTNCINWSFKNILRTFASRAIAQPIVPGYRTDYSDEAGPASDAQGMTDPTFDDSSDTIALPDAPNLGVSNVGFVNVYNTGVQSLQNLGLELFPPLSYTNPTPITGDMSTTEAIKAGFNAMITFFANVPSFFEQLMANTFINYIIDCHVIPATPSTASTIEAIKVGSRTLQTTAYRVTSDYVDVSCGSINIAEYYANFADYITSAKLYLPFVGFVPVKAEWFQAATMSVDYRFNIIDGSFTCWVRSTGRHTNNGNETGTILGQYAGNACVHLPITGATYASMAAGLVGAGAGMAVGAASGNPATLATSAITAMTAHGDIAQSNAYNGSAAFLGCRYPFLMIERPVSSYAMNYQHEVGIPANIYSNIGSVSGFVKADNVHLDNIPCTDAERQMIQSALREGIIV